MRHIKIGSLTLLAGGTRLEREEEMGECQSAACFIEAAIRDTQTHDSGALLTQLRTAPRFALLEVQLIGGKTMAEQLLSDLLMERQGLPTVLGMDYIPAVVKRLAPVSSGSLPGRIYLLEEDPQKCSFLKRYFDAAPEVEVVCDDFQHFMQTRQVQCVASPSTSSGMIAGKYAPAITEWFGNQLKERVQQYIACYFYGEQPVGTSVVIDTGKEGQLLIHTPTMRTLQRILDPQVIYQCMRTTLMCAAEHGIDSVVISTFGGEGIQPQESEMMWKAYLHLKNGNPLEHIDRNVWTVRKRLRSFFRKRSKKRGIDMNKDENMDFILGGMERSDKGASFVLATAERLVKEGTP